MLVVLPGRFGSRLPADALRSVTDTTSRPSPTATPPSPQPSALVDLASSETAPAWARTTSLALQPATGPSGGGVWVTLTGIGVTPGVPVTFDGVPSTSVQTLSAHQLRVLTPPHLPGVVDVVVGDLPPTSYRYL